MSERTFSLVFSGRLVPGRNAAEVEAEFTRRFGAARTKVLFSGKPVTVNRDLGRDDAQKKQKIFEKLGIVVQLVAMTPEPVELSLADAPVTPPKTRAPEPQPEKPIAPPQETEIGVLPDRSAPRRASKASRNVYSPAEIAEAFRDTVEIPPASRNYFARLVPVTALMLLLPLVYVVITLLSGIGTVWLMVTGFGWLADDPSFLRLVGVASCVLGTGLLTLFLLRPLIARIDGGPQPVRLDPGREPILFDLVERVTDAVGAPMPEEILLDSDANASARLTHGAFSSGLTLTIGMPLLYGLDMQSLTGVLAHEFGHFTQKVGMRSSALVHQVNYWFYRQANERDRWDRLVDEWGESEHLVLSLAAVLAQIGSALVRLLLNLLSTLASVFSFSLSRQMEYDADRYEIGLVGSAAYEKTATAMRLLGIGHQIAVDDLMMAFDSDKKVNNLPKLAALKTAAFSEKERQNILAHVEEVNPSVFDSHPSDRERIRKAVEANMPARFVHTGPAEKLLREPDRLGQLVTLQWYRSCGVNVAPNQLTPIEEFASESDLVRNADESVRDYFGDLDSGTMFLPLLMPATLAKLDDARLTNALEQVKEDLRQRKTDFLLLRKRMDEDIEFQTYYRHALFWRRAGFEIDLNAYRLPLTTTVVAEMTAKLAAYKASENEARAGFRRCIELQGQRLSLGLELAVRRGQAEAAEVERLRRAYAAIASADDDNRQLQECGERIDLLLQVLDALPDDPKYTRQLESENKDNKELQRRIRRALGNTPDPFTANAPLTNVLPDAYDGPGERQVTSALDDAARMIRSLGRTSYKVLGRMAAIALAAERHG